VKLPDDIPDEIAVFLSILEVGHIGLRRGVPAIGENVAIVGQGVIGLACLAYCRAFGLGTAVLDLQEERLAVARRLGAEVAVSPDQPHALEQVRCAFGGEGADLALEAASHWNAVRMAMEVTRPEGRVVVVSRHVDQPTFNPIGHPFLGKRLTLLTSYGHEPEGSRWDRRHSIDLTLRLLSTGRLNIEPLITTHARWTELPEIYRRLDAGDRELIGVVLHWE